MFRERAIAEWESIGERIRSLDEKQAEALLIGHAFTVIKQTIAALHLAKSAANTTLGDVLELAGRTLNRGKSKDS